MALEKDGKKYDISTAVGMAFADGLKDIQDVINEADSAMYMSKKEQKRSTAKLVFDENYNDNFDGYYNDVVPEEEALEKEHFTVNVGRIATTILVVIAMILLSKIG